MKYHIYSNNERPLILSQKKVFSSYIAIMNEGKLQGVQKHPV